MAYTSTYSPTAAISKRIFGFDVLFEDIGGRGNQLAVMGQLIDVPGIGVKYARRLWPQVTLDTRANFSRAFDAYLTADSLGYRYQSTTIDAGLGLGFEPILAHKLHLDWDYTLIKESYIPESYADATIDRASMIRSGFSVNKLDSSIFPMDGILSDAEYALSLPQLGSGQYFSTFTWRGGVYTSLKSPISLGFVWKAGTDFSARAGSATSAPYYYKPSLNERSLFPGPIPSEGYIGSHVSAAGIIATASLARLSRAITVPTFLTIQSSAGAVLRDLSDYAGLRAFDRWNWTNAIGVGIRVNEGLGISLKGGVAKNAGSSAEPFFSFDFGAISPQLE